MKKYKLRIVELDNEIVLVKEKKDFDYEIENFKSIKSCVQYLNKNYKKIDKYNNKYFGIYTKQLEVEWEKLEVNIIIC